MDIKKRFFTLILLIIIIFVAGVLGFQLIEGWNLLDSAYMTVITLSTVGFGETHPLSNAGKIFTIFLIIGGLSGFTYGFLTLTTLIAEGDLQRMLRRGWMDKEISKLKDHYIVCGAGELGEHIIRELIETKRKFVVIEKDLSNLKRFNQSDILYVEGDAANDHTLIDSGIERAKGIFCTLPSDKDNLFVVLTSRELNKQIRIITKSVDDASEQKFKRAGADNTVSTNRIGGLRMASEMMRPTVATFLDVMLRDNKGVRFEELSVSEKSKLAGCTIEGSKIHAKTGASIVAIKNTKGEYQYSPAASTTINKNDTLIVLCTVEQAKALFEMV